MGSTKLLIQPGTGITPLLEGIEQARDCIHIVIFRFDRGEIEAALKRAVRRGVFVQALVAHTMAGQGGEAALRKLETRLLADGVSVARTATDLVRYHDKLMVIDKRTLYLLGFNYTYLDMERSRSFGIVTTERAWVREAERLFWADMTRQQYTPECESFVVSPGNSRQQLQELIEAATQQVLIYDSKLSDPDMMRLLAAKVREGVDVRAIGSVGKRAVGVKSARLFMRLHAQAVVCDGERLFLGSQSLRSLELDARREVGIILDQPGIVKQVVDTFESDWARIKGTADVIKTLIAGGEPELRLVEFPSTPEPEEIQPAVVVQAVKSAVKEAIKDALLETLPVPPHALPLKETVKDAAKEALRELIA